MGVPDLQRGGLLDQDGHHHLASPAHGDRQGASEDHRASQEHEKRSEMRREKSVWAKKRINEREVRERERKR